MLLRVVLVTSILRVHHLALLHVQHVPKVSIKMLTFILLEYARHVLHNVVVAEKRPATQAKQLLDSALFVKKPFGQLLQRVESASDHLPATHFTHVYTSVPALSVFFQPFLQISHRQHCILLLLIRVRRVDMLLPIHVRKVDDALILP